MESEKRPAIAGRFRVQNGDDNYLQIVFNRRTSNLTS
jgi:hypothetical protein